MSWFANNIYLNLWVFQFAKDSLLKIYPTIANLFISCLNELKLYMFWRLTLAASWKRRLQVTGCRLQVTGYKLQATGYRLQVTGCRLHAADCSLQIACYRLVTGYRLHILYIPHVPDINLSIQLKMKILSSPLRRWLRWINTVYSLVFEWNKINLVD